MAISKITNDGIGDINELTVDTNTLVVDSTNNQVGIGTSSPEGTLHVENASNNSLIMDAPANRINSIGFQTAGVDKWWLGRADSDQISGDAFFIGIDNGNVTDAGGLSNKLVITQSGNVTLGHGGTYRLDINAPTSSAAKITCDNTPMEIGTFDNHVVKFLQNNTERMRILSGGGLTFNGDTASANALDDYEEGTWTATTDQGTLSSSSTCKYVKVGNLVTVTGLVSNFSNRTSTGGVVIRGLPFATGSTDIAIGATLSRYINATGDATSLYLGASRSFALFYNMNQGSGYDQVTHADLNSASANFHFTVTYRAA